MSTVTTWQTESSSSEDTLGLGEKLGKNCRGGEVFILSSDLGGGKTTLVKGIARGLRSTEYVSSPTFMISKVYSGRDGLVLHHFDFYRLNDPGIVALELAEVIDDKNNVVVVEWSGIVKDVLPADSIIITIDRTASNEDARLIQLESVESKSYILDGLR